MATPQTRCKPHGKQDATAMTRCCVKVCEEQYEYYGYDHIFAKKIKELK